MWTFSFVVDIIIMSYFRYAWVFQTGRSNWQDSYAVLQKHSLWIQQICICSIYPYFEGGGFCTKIIMKYALKCLTMFFLFLWNEYVLCNYAINVVKLCLRIAPLTVTIRAKILARTLDKASLKPIELMHGIFYSELQVGSFWQKEHFADLFLAAMSKWTPCGSIPHFKSNKTYFTK